MLQLKLRTIFSTSGKYFKIIPEKAKYVKIHNNELLINKKLLGEGNSVDLKKYLVQNW